jgi:hypothetical protein
MSTGGSSRPARTGGRSRPFIRSRVFLEPYLEVEVEEEVEVAKKKKKKKSSMQCE